MKTFDLSSVNTDIVKFHSFIKRGFHCSDLAAVDRDTGQIILKSGVSQREWDGWPIGHCRCRFVYLQQYTEIKLD